MCITKKKSIPLSTQKKIKEGRLPKKNRIYKHYPHYNKNNN